MSRACATSTQSFVDGAQAILLGEADIVISGGADSLSKPPVMFSDEFVEVMMKAQGAKDPMSRVKALAGLRPKDLAPRPPAIADRSTGGSMGDSAEIMAKMNGIDRESQDAYAFNSHRKAVEAWERALEADPGFELALRALATLRTHQLARRAPGPRCTGICERQSLHESRLHLRVDVRVAFTKPACTCDLAGRGRQ